MVAMEKMASVSALSVFLLCCFAVSSQGCDHFAASDQSFDVPLGLTLKDTVALKWKFEGNTIFYKREGRIPTGKSRDINADGSLKLTNLEKGQTGVYTSEVYDKNGRSQGIKTTRLCILDPVKKPIINATCMHAEVLFTCSQNKQPDRVRYKWYQNEELISNETEISLKRQISKTKNANFSCQVYNEVTSEESGPLTNTCIEPVKKPEINATCKGSEVVFTCIAAQQPDDAKYKWLLNGKVIINETNISLTRKTAESKKMNFSCEVYNEANFENSDSLTHACDDPFFLGLPEELFGISIWVFIGSGGGLVLVLIVIVIVCCVRCRRKRKTKPKDEEELQHRALQQSSPLPDHPPPHQKHYYHQQ